MRANFLSRLALLEAADPARAWEHTRGLASLLAYAKQLPPRDPFEVDEIQDTGLGQLLREARLGQRDKR
jgi:hypothetical protein